MTKKTGLYLLILLLITADQLSKKAIYTMFMPGESHPVVGGIFHITYVQNTGAAFGIMQEKTFFLIGVTALAIIGLSVYFVLNIKSNSFFVSLALSMIISGGLGNIIDRWRMGYVVDFIDFRVFPVFNVADICVTAGCFFLIISFIVAEKKSHGKKTDHH